MFALKNKGRMTLTAQTKIGLTFGQIITIVVVVFSFAMSYANLTVRINDIEQKTIELEKGRIVNASNIETVRTENRADHQKLMDKMDVLLYKITNK